MSGRSSRFAMKVVKPRGDIALLTLAMLALLLGLPAASHPAEAPPAGRMYRIGYLGESGPDQAPHLRSFEERLRELGRGRTS